MFVRDSPLSFQLYSTTCVWSSRHLLQLPFQCLPLPIIDFQYLLGLFYAVSTPEFWSLLASPSSGLKNDVIFTVRHPSWLDAWLPPLIPPWGFRQATFIEATQSLLSYSVGNFTSCSIIYRHELAIFFFIRPCSPFVGPWPLFQFTNRIRSR
jgi:hypothetical protein